MTPPPGASYTARPPAPGFCPESPALAGTGAPAYELKFLLTEPQARQVEAMLRENLALDPHADPTLGAYRVTSVYFDTPQLDCFHEQVVGLVPRFKVRSRLYADSGHCSFEVKLKLRDSSTAVRYAPVDSSWSLRRMARSAPSGSSEGFSMRLPPETWLWALARRSCTRRRSERTWRWDMSDVMRTVRAPLARRG